MRPLASWLERFRRPAAVPEAAGESVAAELMPVFAALDEIEEAAARVRASAEAEARSLKSRPPTAPPRPSSPPRGRARRPSAHAPKPSGSPSLRMPPGHWRRRRRPTLRQCSRAAGSASPRSSAGSSPVSRRTSGERRLGSPAASGRASSPRSGRSAPGRRAGSPSRPRFAMRSSHRPHAVPPSRHPAAGSPRGTTGRRGQDARRPAAARRLGRLGDALGVLRDLAAWYELVNIEDRLATSRAVRCESRSSSAAWRLRGPAR